MAELVTKIAPEELPNVDAMLAEMDGREEELVDQLASIHERSIAGQSRALGRVVAQSKAKKAARKTVKAKKKAASVSEIATVDVDGMVVKDEGSVRRSKNRPINGEKTATLNHVYRHLGPAPQPDYERINELMNEWMDGWMNVVELSEL